MRRALAALTALTALGFAAPAYAADGDGMTPAIVQCLRDNAPRVEAAEPDLTKATDYLVTNSCAQQVAEEQQRLTNLRLKAIADRNRERCEARQAEQRKNDVNNNRSRTSYDNCAEQYDTMMGVRSIYPSSIVGPRPASVVSMAAKLILDLRVAHNKSRP